MIYSSYLLETRRPGMASLDAATENILSPTTGFRYQLQSPSQPLTHASVNPLHDNPTTEVWRHCSMAITKTNGFFGCFLATILVVRPNIAFVSMQNFVINKPVTPKTTVLEFNLCFKGTMSVKIWLFTLLLGRLLKCEQFKRTPETCEHLQETGTCRIRIQTLYCFV